jgi:hypothetical protein
MRKIILILAFITALNDLAYPQENNLFTSYTTTQSRANLYHNLINTINKNLSKQLNDSSEDYWQQAFWAIELLAYKQPWIEKRVEYAFDSLSNRSKAFQRGLLELINTNYPGLFIPQVKELLQHTDDTKIFSICAGYILQQSHDRSVIVKVGELLLKKFTGISETDPVLIMLQLELTDLRYPAISITKRRFLKELFTKNFLPGNIIMYSIQRKNRNFPGIAVIRNVNGEFLKDSSGKIFSVPQLARSIANLPAYISNGNTPEGIFRMTGFDVSTNNFIGPTPNIQLKMPFEISPQKFLNDSLLTDTAWQITHYKSLLPKNLQNYFSLYTAYYAGEAGRTEIIAHGTTINPEYYKGTPYYPHTPSQGCLCTKEIWNGKLVESDQQQLVYALLKAGGANGYCVVVELDNKNLPVTISDILPYLSTVSTK